MKSVDLLVGRVTITLKPYLNKKIRTLQARKISETKKSVSFSNVVNDLLRLGLKHYGELSK